MLDRDQRIGDRHLGIIMGVDAERHIHFADDLRYDLFDLPRHRPAVGVAQDDAFRPCVPRSRNRREGIVRIGLVPIKKVLGIVKDLALVIFQKRHGVFNQLEIFFQRDAERVGDMQRPTLAEKSDNVRPRLQERLQRRIVLRGVGCPPRGSKSHKLGIFERNRFSDAEKVHILRIRSRPSPFNEVDTEFIQLLRHTDLVLDREPDILGLCAIP